MKALLVAALAVFLVDVTAAQVDTTLFVYSGDFEGHQYWLSTYPAYWNEARQSCENQGGHLVTISSAEENEFVWQASGNVDLWIGFTDEEAEGVWTWVTGEDADYTNWHSGEPNNGGSHDNEDQAMIYSMTGDWNDEDGPYDLYLFMLEIDSPYHYLVPQYYHSIQAAIDASSSGDTVLVSPGTYYENINFNGHNIVVGSLFLTTGDTSYISQTVIDGNQSGTVITFQSGETSSTCLSGFTLTNGQSVDGGGIYCRYSSPTIGHLVITGNQASNCGAAIFCRDSEAAFQNLRITENDADDKGGGLFFS